MTKPMNKIEKLIAGLCPDGVEFKALGEIGTLIRGSGLQKKDFVEDGIGCIHYGQIYTYYGTYANKTKSFVPAELAKKLKKAKKGDVLISGVSENIVDVCKPLGWLGDEVCISGDMFAFRHNQNTKFITYLLQTTNFEKYKERFAHGAKVIRVKQDKILDYEIPNPPLPIQEEIVKILDTFTTLEAELEAELEARKKQYEYYRDELLTFGDEVERESLGKVAEIGTGSSNTNEVIEDGRYPFFVRSPIVRYKNSFEFDETAIITSGDGVGVGKIFHFVDGKYALHQRAYRIHIVDRRIKPKFFFYYMSNNFEKYILGSAVNSSVTSVRKPMLNRYPVPILSLAEQERIVAILDKFDALVNDISVGLPAELNARRKQYEYYRDKLLTFKPLEKEYEK